MSRSPKKKDNSLLLYLIGATGLAAFFLWPKPAAASGSNPAPAPPTNTGGVKVAVVSSGVTAAPIGTPPNTIPFPTFAIPPTATKGGAQLYLEAYGPSGPVLTPAGTAEPSIADIGPSNLSDASDINKLLADKGNGLSTTAFDPYYASPYIEQILAAGGNVLVWTASTDSTKLIKWWLTKWTKASSLWRIEKQRHRRA